MRLDCGRDGDPSVLGNLAHARVVDAFVRRDSDREVRRDNRAIGPTRFAGPRTAICQVLHARCDH